jgi:[histone H3]-lysine36 N-dimethyltransferase SETMAR
MDKEHFRFYIKVRTALHIQPTDIHNELHTVFGDQAPLLRTVQRWSKSFREGREEVEDEERSGRPVTETIPENADWIRDLINNDPYLTVDEIEEQTGLSHGTVQRIISDHLQLRKITARYVPKYLTNSQKAERVRICQENLSKFEQGVWRLSDVVTGDESWFYHKQIGRKSSNAAWVARGGAPPTVVRRSRFAPRTLLSIFFKSTGPVLVHRVERGQTIDHEYYIDNCLAPVLEEIKNQRPSLGVHGIKLHHDNGKPHVHKDVISYLESEDVTIMPHPPNSPDLAPCDFWLFDLIKQNLDDQDNAESLYEAVVKFMKSLKKEEYKKTFDKWTERMKLCINNQREYFEHLL